MANALLRLRLQAEDGAPHYLGVLYMPDPPPVLLRYRGVLYLADGWSDDGIAIYKTVQAFDVEAAPPA